MATQYSCGNERRRNLVRESGDELNGIDFLEVVDQDYVAVFEGDEPAQFSHRQRLLMVHMLKEFDGALNEDNVRIEGGVRVSHVRPLWARKASLVLADDGAG